MPGANPRIISILVPSQGSTTEEGVRGIDIPTLVNGPSRPLGVGAGHWVRGTEYVSRQYPYSIVKLCCESVFVIPRRTFAGLLGMKFTRGED